MENRDRLYIVSFGNSAKFRMIYPGTKEEIEKSSMMKDIKDELTDYMRDKIPVCDCISQFTTPHIREVETRDADKYAGYPDINSGAIEKLKHLVLAEVRDKLALKELNSNAPYDNIS